MQADTSVQARCLALPATQAKMAIVSRLWKESVFLPGVCQSFRIGKVKEEAAAEVAGILFLVVRQNNRILKAYQRLPLSHLIANQIKANFLMKQGFPLVSHMIHNIQRAYWEPNTTNVLLTFPKPSHFLMLQIIFKMRREIFFRYEEHISLSFTLDVMPLLHVKKWVMSHLHFLSCHFWQIYQSGIMQAELGFYLAFVW